MSEFLHRVQHDTFKGILTWEKLDRFWDVVIASRGSGWFTYTVGEPVPQRPAYGEELTVFVRELNATLRRRHRQEHCGMVYTDDMESPSLVVAFDPQKVGGCGSGPGASIPGWTLSREIPEDLVQAMGPTKEIGALKRAADWLTNWAPSRSA